MFENLYLSLLFSFNHKPNIKEVDLYITILEENFNVLLSLKQIILNKYFLYSFAF